MMTEGSTNPSSNLVVQNAHPLQNVHELTPINGYYSRCRQSIRLGVLSVDLSSLHGRLNSSPY